MGWGHGSLCEGWKDLWRTACEWGVVLGEAGSSWAFSAFAVPFSSALNSAPDWCVKHTYRAACLSWRRRDEASSHLILVCCFFLQG